MHALADRCEFSVRQPLLEVAMRVNDITLLEEVGDGDQAG